MRYFEKQSVLVPILSKAVGRVATNLIEPFGYGVRTTEKVRGNNAIKSILHDTPRYTFWGTKLLPEAASAREFAYRKMFGLEPREDVSKLLTKNPEKDSYAFLNSPLRTHIKEDAIHDYPLHGHPVMGSYELNKEKGIYKDVWDFKLNPGEKPNNLVNIARWAIDKITNPVTFEGRVFGRPTL